MSVRCQGWGVSKTSSELPGLLDLLVCPRDKQPLQRNNNSLVCSENHQYRIVEGIPILLLPESQQTHIEGSRSLQVAEAGDAAKLPTFEVGCGEIDPFVKAAIGATNGGLYQNLVGNLKEYPIPKLRLPEGKGGTFLEVGCNWGRWCIAAARAGYRPIGIDPSLKSIRAARRVARQLALDACYVVADGRYLPFRNMVFDQVFSYSVLQHLSKDNVGLVLAEIQRVLRVGGHSQVQMPNMLGIRCLYHQLGRRFREPRDFEVRYWSVRELRSVFQNKIGPTQISVDGFFSLNPQVSDVRLLPFKYRPIVYTSEALRRLSEGLRQLAYVADSLYLSSMRSR